MLTLDGRILDGETAELELSYYLKNTLQRMRIVRSLKDNEQFCDKLHN